MKNLRTFENFKINEGLITLTDDEIRQLNNLLPKIEGAILASEKDEREYFDVKPCENPLLLFHRILHGGVHRFIGIMNIITKNGKEKKVGFRFMQGNDKKIAAQYRVQPEEYISAKHIHDEDEPTVVYIIEINKKHFSGLPKEGGKLNPSSRGILSGALIHELIHAKDLGVEFNLKKELSKDYFERDIELKAFGGTLVQQIELAVDNFLRGGIKSQEDLDNVEQILKDFLEAYKSGKFPSLRAMEFRLNNNLKIKGFFGRLFTLFSSNWRVIEDALRLKEIKKSNPEGYRDFISNLFVRLKRCEEKINKAISDSGLNFKPISITKGKYS